MSVSPLLEAARTRPPVETGPPQQVLVVARWPVGGIRTHLAYNAPTLFAGGFSCTFVGPDDSSLEGLRATLGPLPGAQFVGAPVQGKECYLRGVVRRLLRTGQYHLVHSHGLTAGVATALANLAIGVPHLCTVHDPLRTDQFPGWKGPIKRWLLGQLARRMDTLVCVSGDIRANLLDYLSSLRPERLVTICNGVDTARYRGLQVPHDGELRRSLNLRPGTVLLGFMGRFMEQKGFLPLLGALQKLREGGAPRPFHLLAVGSLDREREYRREVMQRGLGRFVTLHPFVPDVQPVLRQLDLLVVPSLWEASSLLSMEAMAAGVPVLGTDCIGLREVLRDTPSRTVRAGDVADLARGLREALARPWTEEARHFAREAWDRFDNEPGARRLAELYGALAR
jgi:glycosyltransferase involved in cell wall biosynthesis